MSLRLTPGAARTLMLAAQGLHRPPAVAATKDSLLDAIRHSDPPHVAPVLRRAIARY